MQCYKWLLHYRIRDERIWFLDVIDTHLPVPGKLSRLMEEKRVFSGQQLEECIDNGLLARLLNEGVIVPVKSGSSIPGNVRNKEILVIQPHSDDFALSCGAVLAKLKFDRSYYSHCHIHCLTLFSQHSHKGFPWRDKVEMSDESYSDLRAMEDRLSLDYLSGQVTFLGYKDALCRGLHPGFLFSRADIFRKDRALIPEISTRLVEIINHCNPVQVFLPAAIGWHCDHRIAYMAAVDALKKIKTDNKKILELFLYEDYPYCDESRTNYWARLDQLTEELHMEPLYVDISEYIEDKAILINFYKSQLMGTNLSQIRQKMEQLAESTVIEARFHREKHPDNINNMRLAERLWQIQGFK